MMSCCDYGEFYEDEGLMPPIHDCPAPVPIPEDDLERPLTQLEEELLASIRLRLFLGSGGRTILSGRRLR